MTVTVGTQERIKLSPQNWMTITPVTMDSAYVVGGEALTADQLGLTLVKSAQVRCVTGRQLQYDITNSKLMSFTGVAALSETAPYASWVDSGATGTYTFTNTVPAGMHILGSKLACSAAFSGDTSAVWKAGIAGALDRYSADTGGSCFTAITTGSLSTAATGSDGIAAAVTPVFTITSNADFTNVSAAASAVCTINYCSSSGALIEDAVGTNLSAVIGYVTAIGR